MAALPLHRSDLTTAHRLASAAPAPAPRWELPALAGGLVELSAHDHPAALTLAFALVLDAQQRGEPVAWIARVGSSFYPPDVAEGGVDLGALAVVRAPGLPEALRAADHLARSGAFGLVVLDLGDPVDLPLAAQTRLGGLAARYDVLLLFLTRKKEPRPSLGSLVTVRAEATRALTPRVACRLRVLKDKRRGPGWGHEEPCRGPDGLR